MLLVYKINPVTTTLLSGHGGIINSRSDERGIVVRGKEVIRSKFFGWAEIFLLLLIGGIYLQTQSQSIYGGDAGDLASAVITRGIPHPPGYPLYTAIGVLITNIISFGSYAWRVGLLSAIPSLFSLLILYQLLTYLTQKRLLSFISVLTIALLYPIWLYSSVVEVFALNNFFLVALLYLSVRFYKERKLKYLYLISFIFGLALSHHQIIIFLLPGLVILLKGAKVRKFKHYFKGVLYFLAGLTPYLYTFVSAGGNPAVNWMGKTDLISFWQLVTRAGYGTFRAGSFTMHAVLSRFLNLWAFGNIFYQDFRMIGVIAVFAGIAGLWMSNRRIFWAVSVSILSYLFFLFYASFPLVDNFLVGTFERFVQPLYMLSSVFFVYGLIMAGKLYQKLITRFFDQQKTRILTVLFETILLIIPLGIFTLNYPKISILKNDFTAENFARDILNSVSKNSILILTTDTALFNTQYLYYAENKWPAVKIIHSTKLYTPYYADQLKKFYPELNFENKDKISSNDEILNFILANYGTYPIYTKTSLELENGVFIPYGVVFRFYKDKDQPDKKSIYEENVRLLRQYHNPLSGSLAKYQNLMLSDVIKNYAFSYQEVGFWAAKNNYHDFAEENLILAEKVFPEDADSYIILAQVYILEKRCKEADAQLDTLLKIQKNSPEGLLLKSMNYRDCFKDQEKAAEYEKLYDENKRGQEVKLDKL